MGSGHGRDLEKSAAWANRVADRIERAEAEASRIADVVSRGAVPGECSPKIIPAPARGPAVVHRPVEAVLTDNGPRLRHGTEQGFHALLVNSPLQRMEIKAQNAMGEDYTPRYTTWQHKAAFDYAMVAERMAKGRMKCTNLDGLARGGAESVTDAYVIDKERYERMRERIGLRVALRFKGSKAFAKQGRKLILCLDLVERVCHRGDDFQTVLRAHQWQVRARYYERLHEALRASLDSLYGF
ncbi:hypothetical protein [uncultured Roseobacter sp.]|uniref:hypothetical protein n=1 Tax=uncultured Roseobacter sp. TaxID=114847 RepID=UPI002639D267|nr:hypothetical protein [uncultured Roseobacter sp.]